MSRGASLKFDWITRILFQLLSVFNTEIQLFVTEGGVAKNVRGKAIGHTDQHCLATSMATDTSTKAATKGSSPQSLKRQISTKLLMVLF